MGRQAENDLCIPDQERVLEKGVMLKGGQVRDPRVCPIAREGSAQGWGGSVEVGLECHRSDLGLAVRQQPSLFWRGPPTRCGQGRPRSGCRQCPQWKVELATEDARDLLEGEGTDNEDPVAGRALPDQATDAQRGCRQIPAGAQRWRTGVHLILMWSGNLETEAGRVADWLLDRARSPAPASSFCTG
jgi:hypothetical protein